MRTRRKVIPIVCWLVAAASAGAAPLRVLLLSGANNHAWQETTPVLRTILEASGRSQVDVTEDVPGLTAGSFAPYDVILSNYNTFKNKAPTDTVWSAAVRAAFLAHIRAGHGFVVVHAGSSVFYDWPEFQQLATTSWTLDTTRHGQRHAAPVTFTAVDHPITRGLKPFWIFDEFWENLVLQPGATVLATVTPSPLAKGGGKPQPSLLVAEYGRGRSVCLLLGHDVPAMKNPAFRTLLVRATEWAARSAVTVLPPADWPEAEATALGIAGPAAVAAAQPKAPAKKAK